MNICVVTGQFKLYRNLNAIQMYICYLAFQLGVYKSNMRQ